jgi:hypothetical protein
MAGKYSVMSHRIPSNQFITFLNTQEILLTNHLKAKMDWKYPKKCSKIFLAVRSVKLRSEPLSYEFLVSCGISLGTEKLSETENV